MRIKSVLKNSTYSIASYGILAVLGLINRKAFVYFLGIELLGYEGLFANIFSILSLAELGVSSVITYSLYEEIVNDNEAEIAKLMMIYQLMYRIIGFAVTIIGITLFFFLPYIIKDNTINWNYVRIIYLVQLIATVCTYFLSYKRILYVTDQKEFVCVKVDTLIKIVMLIVQTIIIVFLKNYILYLLCTVFSNIIANIIIARKCDKAYPYAKKAKITFADFKKRHFFKDLKNFLVHKISYVVYGGTDNIVISAILGIQSVALYSNYVLIKNQIISINNKIMQPMQASIGNLIYTENKEKAKELFNLFDLLSFFFAAFVGTSYSVLFQPFIALWLGDQYLLPVSFVFFLAFNEFLGCHFQILCLYRNAFGSYENDKKYMVLSAITNLILSIGLAPFWGITGIVFGTVIGHLFIIYGRMQFVFRLYFKTSMKHYILVHLGEIGIAVIEFLLTYKIALLLPNTFIGFMGKIGLCLLIPTGINLIIFMRTKEFTYLRVYGKTIIKLLKGKSVDK
ncbi:MAG: oligosaccharide flippase family protein [Eubacterium sp.]